MLSIETPRLTLVSGATMIPDHALWVALKVGVWTDAAHIGRWSDVSWALLHEKPTHAMCDLFNAPVLGKHVEWLTFRIDEMMEERFVIASATVPWDQHGGCRHVYQTITTSKLIEDAIRECAPLILRDKRAR